MTDIIKKNCMYLGILLFKILLISMDNYFFDTLRDVLIKKFSKILKLNCAINLSLLIYFFNCLINTALNNYI